jgi:hypothetical protein
MRLDSPPLFSQFEKIGSWLPIADLSVAGASIMCRFPGVMNINPAGYERSKCYDHFAYGQGY